jgi:N6-L-threonylcarbamoyladenine synthase
MRGGSSPLLLAIETSCDETAVAIVRGRANVLASRISSQILEHRPHGGIVPEIASRNHVRLLPQLIESAASESGISLTEVDAFAATSGPGLASSLMVGLSAAKGMAVAAGRPFLAVNHMEGHLLSPFFVDGADVQPSVALIVSGGHTLLVKVNGFGDYVLLGRTVDDAAGEAFDKVAKMLGLDYPGGPVIERLARDGDPQRYEFPRSMLHSGDFQFSFSGLKTSVRYLLPTLKGDDWLPDVCASFQEAVVDVLVEKSIRAVKASEVDLLTASGGVSCNGYLRKRLADRCAREGIRLLLAEPSLCTDNAVMIARVAVEKFLHGESTPLTADIDPNLKLAAEPAR